MTRTTDEWAALLDGTTPGPWFANVRGFGRIENIGPISTGFSIGDGLECDEDDAELAALAPEAVAEVVRLRRELEELREVFVRAAEMMGKFEIPADRQQAQGFAGRITRILEGTHE